MWRAGRHDLVYAGCVHGGLRAVLGGNNAMVSRICEQFADSLAVCIAGWPLFFGIRKTCWRTAR